MRPASKRPNARTVGRLAEEAAEAAAETPDSLAELSASIKRALPHADPYVLLGVLLEGITQALVTRIPEERHPATIAAALATLNERLAAKGRAPGAVAPCDQQPSCN